MYVTTNTGFNAEPDVCYVIKRTNGGGIDIALPDATKCINARVQIRADKTSTGVGTSYLKNGATTLGQTVNTSFPQLAGAFSDGVRWRI